jgi:hypothetical protein
LTNYRSSQSPILQEENEAADVATGSLGYISFTVAQLREEIKTKGLNQRGPSKLKKIELISLLKTS